MDGIEKYEGLVKKVAKDIYENIVDILEPDQYDSELLKDISQDIWLELYSLKSVDPDINDKEIEMHLLQNEFHIGSLPDSRIIYTDRI